MNDKELTRMLKDLDAAGLKPVVVDEDTDLDAVLGGMFGLDNKQVRCPGCLELIRLTGVEDCRCYRCEDLAKRGG